jgi:predicted transcriptional regulator
MTRLNESVPAEELHTVLTDLELTHTAKVVWVYMRASADPLRMRPMTSTLGMAKATVERCMKALEAKGLVRKVSGVWLAEEGR